MPWRKGSGTSPYDPAVREDAGGRGLVGRLAYGRRRICLSPRLGEARQFPDTVGWGRGALLKYSSEIRLQLPVRRGRGTL